MVSDSAVIALDRVLKLLESAPARPDVSRGHLDLLGEVQESHDTVAQRLMRSGALPRIYEWAATGLASPRRRARPCWTSPAGPAT
jgi:hypothetical protein